MEIEVSDPTDWQSTALPLLFPLDAGLRCQVCKDFFDAAVTTSCGHTFCSRCVRRAIATDGKCPACRTGIMEHTLRRNVAIQEVVEAFRAARSSVFELARKPSDPASPPARKRKHDESMATRTRRQSKRMKYNDDEYEEVMIVDSTQEDEVEAGLEARTRVLKSPQDASDDLVKCPICECKMKEESVFAHLDKCEGPEKEQMRLRQPTQRKASKPANIPERLPQLNYSLLKERDLRKRLDELGLSTVGSKPTMIRRHKEWVAIVNSNSDSLKPRGKRDLLHDLDQWERSAPALGLERPPDGSGMIMSKSFDGIAHAQSHRQDFQALIARAKAGRTGAKTGADIENAGECVEAATKSVDPQSHDATQQKHHEMASPAESMAHSAAIKQRSAHRRSSDSLQPRLNGSCSNEGRGQERNRAEIRSPGKLDNADPQVKTVGMFELPRLPVADIDNSGFDAGDMGGGSH